MNKHYIRIDNRNLVTHAFSDAFEQPLVTDICIDQNGGRHFQLDIFTEPTIYKWKYDTVNNVLVEDLGASQTAEIDAIKMNKIRTERDRLLSDSDRMMLADIYSTLAPAKQTEWATYRQALRDLPLTVDVNNPIYPAKPL